MRVVKEISIGGTTVEVRELTVADIRAWLKDMETTAPGADILEWPCSRTLAWTT